MISLGCAKNQVDAEVMLRLLEEDGFASTGDPAEADILCINTCGFIDSAKQEAIDTILEMAEYKKNGRCRGLIVTGCLAERYPDEIAQQLPEVDAILGIGGYGKICEAVRALLAPETAETPGTPGASGTGLRYRFHEKDYSLSYLDSGRCLTTPKSYAYLKIAEGCSNCCAYCAIPSIRGPFRSRPLAAVLQEAKRLAAEGVRELVVVAQDTTRYGTDLTEDGRSLLPQLIAGLDGIAGVEWVRLLYLYPDEITEEIIRAIRDSRKTLHYLDLPLQHISDSVLKRMNRRGDGQLIRDVLKKFREALPDCVIRTSLITGFPGETEQEHGELLEFVRTEKLDRVGVFQYSKEEGTRAASLRPQIPKRIKEKRYAELMKAQREISYEKNIARVGNIYDVMVDGVSEDGLFYTGRSYAEAPDSDGVIYFAAKDELRAGDLVKVKILIAEEYDLTGEQV